MKKKIVLLILLLNFCFFISCVNSKEKIIYGDIDINAPEAKIVKPQKDFIDGNIKGNTYLNICQGDGALFSSDKNNYYYVIYFENNYYLIKEDKITEKKEKIYNKNIRNILVVNNWIYGIVNENNEDYLVVLDVNGNNVIENNLKYSKITSLISDGEFLYYTIKDTRYNSDIFKSSIDMTENSSIKKATSIFSLLETITVSNNKIYYNEDVFSDYETNSDYIYTKYSKKDFPIIENDNIYYYSQQQISQLLNMDIKINAINYDKKIIYISVSQNNENFMVFLDNEKKTFDILKTKTQITQIYYIDDNIIIYDGTFKKLERDDI